MLPRRIGISQAGFIEKNVSPTAIQPPYDLVASSIVEYVRGRCSRYLHSAYLAGSIPAGTATLGRSDIDITLVFQDASPPQAQKDSADLRHYLLATYPFLPKVDLVSAVYADVTAPENRYGWGFWLQHCCACIYGADIGQEIELFRPSWQLVHGLNGDIKQYNQRVKSELLTCPDDQTCAALGSSIARKYIRSAYCLVAVPEESYVDELSLCVTLFLRHYAIHEKTMGVLLRYARDPAAHAADIVWVVETFGVWLEDQYTSIPSAVQ